jgi:hypothetical protein
MLESREVGVHLASKSRDDVRKHDQKLVKISPVSAAPAFACDV